MRCPNCGARVRSSDEYCQVCDTRLRKKNGKSTCTKDVCPVCGAEVDDDTEFCDNCGAHIAKESTEHPGETAAEAYSCRGDHDWSNTSPEVSDEHAGETFVEAYSCEGHKKPVYRKDSAEAYYNNNVGSDEIRKQYAPPKFKAGDIFTVVLLLILGCGPFMIAQILMFCAMKTLYRTGKPEDYLRIKKTYKTTKVTLVSMAVLFAIISIVASLDAVPILW